MTLNPNIDPKVVMELSTFKIGGWNNLQPNNQHFLQQCMDENEPWLLIGIPNSHSFVVSQYMERHSVRSDQHMKKLVSLRECLHVMMQCHHFADRYLLHEHSTRTCILERTHDEEIHRRINHVLRTKTCVQMECSEDAIRIK